MTNDNEFDPWREHRYTIERLRTILPDAAPSEMRAALGDGLDWTGDLIAAAVRHPEREWQFHRAAGAAEIIIAIGRRLDRP